MIDSYLFTGNSAEMTEGCAMLALLIFFTDACAVPGGVLRVAPGLVVEQEGNGHLLSCLFAAVWIAGLLQEAPDVYGYDERRTCAPHFSHNSHDACCRRRFLKDPQAAHILLGRLSRKVRPGWSSLICSRRLV